MATATTEPVRLPPGPRLPKMLQGIAFVTATHGMFDALAKRYGGTFTVNLPVFGQTVVTSDPNLVRDLFTTSTDLVERPTTLGEFFGPGSLFSLAGNEMLERRRLLVPPFHGKRVRSYEHTVEEEVLREVATWPEGREFETQGPMQRITLGVILRIVFGAEGQALAELRRLLPPTLSLGARLALLPSVLRHDWGPWSPWGRFLRYRRQVDAVVGSLITGARADPALDERGDVVALMVRARYDDGEPIPDRHIADELLTMVTTGHETTASALAWAVERIRRHPLLISRLTEEADAGGSELRQATICEVQRTRPVIDGLSRRTVNRIRLSDWVIPEDTTVIFSIRLAHASERSFPDATSFNPDRFVGAVPNPFEWIPFGGGVNRCIGAALANMEMDVTLRTLLRELRFAPTDAPAERRHSRGVTTAPARGGRAVVYRRAAEVCRDADSASTAINAVGLAPVEQTAFLTLYARALDSRCQRPILFDSLAPDVAAKLNYDFDALRVPASVRCPVALRAKMLDERVQTFVSEHPDAIVVDLGAGLDNRIVRSRPPSTVDWYNVDLPAVIALRDAALPAGRQEHSVGARIGDPGWAHAIPADRPTILVADGLTAFLSEPVMVNLFQTVTDHFRTGELAFNDYGRVGRVGRTAMKLAPQRSVKAFGPNWNNPGFADARRPEEWNPRLTLVEEISLADAPEVELFPLHMRLVSRLARHIPALARKARILRYRF